MSTLVQKEKNWRQLTAAEITRLEERGSICNNWQKIVVESPFNPEKINSCIFMGEVKIGAMKEDEVSDGEVTLPVGLYHSTLDSCSIGANTALHRLGYCRGYQIGDNTLLSSVKELRAGPQFEAELTKLPFSISLMNESGGREIFPLPGMTTSIAWAWAKFRDRGEFITAMEQISLRCLNSRQQPFRAVVAPGVSIRNCGTIRDTSIGPGSRIAGAQELRSIVIDSSTDNPVRIGTGSIMEDGVISPGCTVDRGSTLQRFFLAENVSIDLNARITDTWVGDNSHIACCEVRSALLFPGHEQHHNNSFLIAANLQGMSNIAAGATIGSNHNSRAADNELCAARGFWPGLCTSLKHPSIFASFCLIAKGDYPAELNIPLPFALVNNNAAEDVLEIMPAYWWMYNKYALFRNSMKVRSRDRRVFRHQPVTSAFLAPDTADEILGALKLLADPETPHRFERSRRRVSLLKKNRAVTAYREMLTLYAAISISRWITAHNLESWHSVQDALGTGHACSWINFGGAVTALETVESFIAGTESGELDSLEKQRANLEKAWSAEDKSIACHGFSILTFLYKTNTPAGADWNSLLKGASEILTSIEEEVLQKRVDDHTDPFRSALYSNESEKTAVLRTPDKNPFSEEIRKENKLLRKQFDAARF